MTTHTANLVYDNSSLANFKAWGSGISAGIAAIGWTQTTDTGQVNWSTIASVPSSTFVYEIWKSSDALSSTLPIFLRVDYGFSGTTVRAQISAGTGSSGAGVLTGTLLTSAPWQITSTSTNQGVTTFPCFFAGNGGNLYMYLWSTNTNAPAIASVVCVERSKNGAGADTADYFTVLVFSNSTIGTNTFQQTITPAGAGPRDIRAIALVLTSGAGTGLAFGTTAAYPVFPNIGKVGNPLLGVLTAFGVDVANGSSCTVASMYGATHTYTAANPGGNFSSSINNGGSGTAAAALILFE